MKDISQGRINLASTQTRNYLKERNLGDCKISILQYEKGTDTFNISISFNQNLSSQNLMDITKFWFWNLNSDFSKWTDFNHETNTLQILLRFYATSNAVYSKLLKLDATVHGFKADSTSFTFEASPKNRVDFLYEDLDEIRAIVDPARSNGFSVYQLVKANSSSLRIYPSKR